MKTQSAALKNLTENITTELWKPELEIASRRYHLIGCWAAIIFDPVFAFTDYLNIPEYWKMMFIIRIGVAMVILLAVTLQKRVGLSTHALISIPFILISFQNSFTYTLVGNEDLLGHNLNYMALLIGAAMFVLWPWLYSLVIVLISIVATSYFVYLNPSITFNEFFLNGGLLLIAVAVFMMVLIQTRYNLTVREIRARLALQQSNLMIQVQAEEIKVINENLESQVQARTMELEQKNKAIEEYAFINAHKLRSPLASILGLVNLLGRTELNDEARHIMDHMSDSARKLDAIVSTITKAVEAGEFGREAIENAKK